MVKKLKTSLNPFDIRKKIQINNPDFETYDTDSVPQSFQFKESNSVTEHPKDIMINTSGSESFQYKPASQFRCGGVKFRSPDYYESVLQYYREMSQSFRYKELNSEESCC